MDYPFTCNILLTGQNTSKLQSHQVEKLWDIVSSYLCSFTRDNFVFHKYSGDQDSCPYIICGAITALLHTSGYMVLS